MPGRRVPPLLSIAGVSSVSVGDEQTAADPAGDEPIERWEVWIIAGLGQCYGLLRAPSGGEESRRSGPNSRPALCYKTSRQGPQPTDADAGTAPGPRYGPRNTPQTVDYKLVVGNWLCFVFLFCPSSGMPGRRVPPLLRIAGVSSVSVGDEQKAADPAGGETDGAKGRCGRRPGKIGYSQPIRFRMLFLLGLW